MEFNRVDLGYELKNNIGKIPTLSNILFTDFQIKRDGETITILPYEYFNNLKMCKILLS